MIQFDPRSPDFRRNPYPYYDMLRTHAPVFFWDAWGTYFLTRWEDCNALLRDNRLGHGGTGEPAPQQQDLYRMQANWMLFRDPPDHTRLRGLAQRAFTPRMVEQMRTTIQDITDGLLDKAAAKDHLDVVADLAYPLPVTVIARMFGVPEGDLDIFHTWSDALAKSLDLTEVEEVYNEASRAAAAFTAYLAELADRRRVEPADDLLSALVAAEEEGDRLTTDELYATCALLLVAGHETTVNLIGNGTLALLRNPEQLALLRAQPELVKSAVEELLRYDGPVQATSRVVLEEFQLDGKQMPRGMTLHFMLGAANHDPAVFAAPSVLDITRKPNPHLGFGGGIHYCLGAPLARLEAQIAFSTLLQRFPVLTLLEADPPPRDNYLLRGLARLPVGV